MHHLHRRRLLNQALFRNLLISLAALSIFLGLIIVPIERPYGNITSYFDGLWWAVGTVTTVGYGDYVPVTILGRVIGIVVQLAGSVIFGTLVAFFATFLVRKQDEFYWRRLFERLDKVDEDNQELLKRTGYQVKQLDQAEQADKT